MTSLLRWYLVVQVLGWLALVIIAPTTRALADRGLALSKAVGVLFCGLILWLGTAAGLLRNELGGAVLAVLTMIALAHTVLWRDLRGRHGSIVPGVGLVIATELVFLFAFIGWAFVRSMDPAANHTEQTMDLMLLTTAAASPTFPPQDAWLAGYPVAYYYVGYWLMSTIAALAGVEPAVAYNVGQACWFALLVVACFGLGVNLSADALERNEAHRTALLGGLLTAGAVTLTSNLHFPGEVLRAGRSAFAPMFSGAWWWWPSSRVVTDVAANGASIEVITEFPFFSYLLGDNHPHVLAMPFVAALIGLVFAWFRGGVPTARGQVVVLGAIAAALIPINTWDLPLACALVLVGVAGAGLHPRGGRAGRLLPIVKVGGTLVLIAAVVAAPFLLTAQSQIQGVLPNLFHPTQFSELATAFGTLAPGVALLLVIAWRERPPSLTFVLKLAVAGAVICAAALSLGVVWSMVAESGKAWLDRAAVGVASPFSVASARWLAGWPGAAVLVSAIAVCGGVLAARRRDAVRVGAVAFGVLLAALGLGLVLVPELMYAHDVFENRMNTVFKLYYQAWLLFAVSSALGIVAAWTQSGAWRIAAIVALSFMSAGLVYPPLAIWDRTDRFGVTPRTLDSLAYLRRHDPDEHAAIEWVARHTPRGGIVLSAVGQSYQAAHNRISAATARPTLLGWEGHERQWRGAAFAEMAGIRALVVQRVYNPASEDDLQRTLGHWNIALVFVGPVERSRYSLTAEHEERIARVMELAFDRGRVRIYRRRG